MFSFDTIKQNLAEYDLLMQHVTQAEARDFKASATRHVLTFRVNYATNFGQSVVVVGSLPFLGSWELKHALKLSWTRGDFWTATVAWEGEVDNMEYKYVVVSENWERWEYGENRMVESQMGEIKGGKLVHTLEDSWRDENNILN